MSRSEAVERSWPPILALGVLVVALWAQTDALVGVFYDDGIYVTLAKALAEGQGYRSIHLPGAPPAVHYPPLYPFMLAGLWKLWPSFPANVTLFKLFDAAALAGATWVIAVHARRMELPTVLRYVTLALGLTAFPILTLVGVRFSEPLFLLLLAGAVLASDRDGAGIGSGIVAGLLAGLATLTRSIGIAAIVGIPVSFWLRRQRIAAAVSLACGVALLAPWMLWSHAHAEAIDPLLASNYGTYAQYAGQAGAGGVLAGLDFRALSPFPRLLLPAVPTPLFVALTLLLVAAVLVGVVRLLSRVTALVLVLVPYVLVVALWPFTPDRFMWILLPWVALFGVAGALFAWRSGHVTRVAALLLLVAVVAGFGRREARSIAGRRFGITAQRASLPFQVLTAAITQGVPDSAIVASDGEAMIFLYADRLAVPAYLFRLRGRGVEYVGTQATVAFLCGQRVTHVATSWLGGEVMPLLDSLAAMPDSTLVPLFTVRDGPGLYRFRCPG